MNTVRIIGLTILALLSISPMVMASNPHKPVLTTQLFSQPVVLSHSLTNQNVPCISGGFVTLGLYNFTENLAGRDPGSTLVQFNGEALILFRTSDLAVIIGSVAGFAAGCAPSVSFTSWTQKMLVTDGSGWQMLWRPTSSGNYTVVLFGGGPASSPVIPVSASETWTVTTIS